VLPKVGSLNGSCISGVWSFSVKIPIPRVELTTPENGSVIKSMSPTLVWELDYNGSDKVTYELYFGTISELELKMDKIPATYFSIFGLDDNTTYSWYIVPWASEIKGPRSEVWWFTVNLSDEDFQPNFDLDLAIYPSTLELAPGDKSFPKATVTNLGNSNDDVSLRLMIPAGKGVDTMFNGSNTTEIAAGDNYTFDLTVLINKDAKRDTIQIIVVAESNFAKKYNLTVEELAILTVVIKKLVSIDSDRSSLDWSILIIIIIIVCIIIILAFLANKKKKKEQVEEKKELEKEISKEPDLTSIVVEVEDHKTPTIDISTQEAPLVIKQSNELDSTITETDISQTVNEEDIEE
jgi:hypothetical protein